jgi:hypothetical protein
MLLFLDETFRRNDRTGAQFAALCGIAVAEPVFPSFLDGVYRIRRPYHGSVLDAEDELKGKIILNRSVLDARDRDGASTKWSMAEDLIHFAHRSRIKVFGVVTFDQASTTLVCDNPRALDQPFRKLFTRVDRYMKVEHPGVYVKVVFDSRQDTQNRKNSEAITNFLTRSTIGGTYDSIVRVPFFGVSQAQNYGLQVADLVTTVIGLKFSGESRVDPLWHVIQRMLYRTTLGDRRISSLALIKQRDKQRDTPAPE